MEFFYNIAFFKAQNENEATFIITMQSAILRRNNFFYISIFLKKIFSISSVWLRPTHNFTLIIKETFLCFRKQTSRCAPCADTSSGNDSCICITASAFATQAARKSTYVNVKKNNTSEFSPRDVRDTIYIVRTIIISIRVMRVACHDALPRSFVGDFVGCSIFTECFPAYRSSLDHPNVIVFIHRSRMKQYDLR